MYKTQRTSWNTTPISCNQKNSVKISCVDDRQENGSDPNIWGPHFWYILHNNSAKYPQNPSNCWKERMKNFILGIPSMVPCEKCIIHSTQYIEQHRDNLDNIVSTRENLFKWFVDFHNEVNIRNGKCKFTLQMAKEKWSY